MSLGLTIIGTSIVPTTTTTTRTVTTTADAPADALFVAFIGTDTMSTLTIGIASVSPAAGALGTFDNKAGANRASSVAENMWVAPITTTIPSGTDVTVTTTAPHSKAGIVLGYISEQGDDSPNVMTGDVASGKTGGDNYGYNGAGNINQALPATSVINELLVVCVGVTGTSAFTPGAEWTVAASARTTTGSSDRGVVVLTKTQATASSATVTATFSGGWALSAMSFEPGAQPIPHKVITQTRITDDADDTTAAVEVDYSTSENASSVSVTRVDGGGLTTGDMTVVGLVVTFDDDTARQQNVNIVVDVTGDNGTVPDTAVVTPPSSAAKRIGRLFKINGSAS